MDVFALRNRVIDEYQQYVSGFVPVKEPGARASVDLYFNQDRLWPEPLVQFNPAFEPRRWIDELVKEGVLHKAAPAPPIARSYVAPALFPSHSWWSFPERRANLMTLALVTADVKLFHPPENVSVAEEPDRDLLLALTSGILGIYAY